MESGSPLTLQLAARVERVDPPAISEIAAATVLATLRLLADDRSAPGGSWHAPVVAWNGARIRKLVRRARGAAWMRVQGIPGVTATVGRAEVRAFVPGPRAEAPLEVQKLQIQSPPLPAPAETHHLPPAVSDTMLLALTPNPWMSWGKQAAQFAHGAQRLIERHPSPPGWLEHPKILVVHPCRVLWQQLTELDPVEIHDGGYTEIPAGTLTIRAQWLPKRRGV